MGMADMKHDRKRSILVPNPGIVKMNSDTCDDATFRFTARDGDKKGMIRKNNRKRLMIMCNSKFLIPLKSKINHTEKEKKNKI